MAEKCKVQIRCGSILHENFILINFSVKVPFFEHHIFAEKLFLIFVQGENFMQKVNGKILFTWW